MTQIGCTDIVGPSLHAHKPLRAHPAGGSPRPRHRRTPGNHRGVLASYVEVTARPVQKGRSLAMPSAASAYKVARARARALLRGQCTARHVLAPEPQQSARGEIVREVQRHRSQSTHRRPLVAHRARAHHHARQVQRHHCHVRELLHASTSVDPAFSHAQLQSALRRDGCRVERVRTHTC